MGTSETTPRHPIRVVAQRTGLTPAAIRAWERRYGAVRPTRSEGGQRLYTDRDVARLLTLRELTEAGRPISMVAGLSDEEASALLQEDREATGSDRDVPNGIDPKRVVGRAFAQMVELDADGLERTLWNAVVTLEGHSFLEEVVGPLLIRIGEAWEAGEVDPGQEHLASDVIDRILAQMIDTSRSSGGPKLVVTTLPGERHGLGARLVSAKAAVDGWSVTHLGTDLPVEDIASTARGIGAKTVAISVVSRDGLDETHAALTRLRHALDPAMILVVGGGASELLDSRQLPDGIEILEGLQELKRNGR